MAKQSSVNLDITNNADGFDISGGTTVRKLGITGGDVTIAGSGSATVTFPTTSTTIAGLGITQSFSALQSFSAGISASGGVTLAGTLQGTTANFTGLVSSTTGFSGSGTNLTNIVNSFNGRTGAVQGVSSASAGTGISVSAATGAITITNTGVQTFNGLTGAVTGASLGANTFTALNSFNAGISAAGGVTLAGTFSGTTGSFSRLLTASAGISASALTVSGGATFGTLNASDIYSTNLSAITQYTNGLLPYTGTVISINNNGNLTTIGDYGFEGDSDFLNNGTYISVNDDTQLIRLKAGNGIDNIGSFLNSVSAPSFIDTYSFCQTYRTTTTATTANQTIATIPEVYDNTTSTMFYPAFEVTISARDTVLNKTEMLKMLVVQDGTNTVNTQYGLIRTGATGPVSSYSTTLTGALGKNLLIRATPLSANSTVFTTTIRAQQNG